MRSRAPTRSVLGLVPLVHLARGRGVDPDALLRAARIEPALLDDPSARVPFARELAFVRALLDRTGDPALGLDAGRSYQLAMFGLLGAAVGAAPTLRDVIRVFLEHLDLTFTPFAVVLEEPPFGDARGISRLAFVDDVELGALRRFYLERDLAFVIEVARTLFPDGHRAIARRVQLDFPEPAESARHRATAPCEVVFGADVACIELDLSLDRPRAGGSAIGLRLLEEQLRLAFGPGGPTRDLAARVRREIAIAVGTRAVRPDARTVAEALDLSERTLRRKLAEAGLGFRALEDEVLARLARRHLERGDVSLAAISERLGYAEAASFVRAHRRWTGRTPRGRRSSPRS